MKRDKRPCDKLLTMLLLAATLCCGCATYDAEIDKLIDQYFKAEETEVEKDDWQKSPLVYDVKGKSSIQFETKDINWTNMRNEDGGWEYIFLTLKGKGFDRIMVYHCGGAPGRKGRIIFGDHHNENAFETYDGRLIPPAKWNVSWANGNGMVTLNGQVIFSESFNGKPEKAIVGGYWDHRRNFNGQYRNVVTK